MHSGIKTVIEIETFNHLNFYTMSGRGDNNKHGSSGRGASNQSNQPMENASTKGKSNHNKNAKGGTPSTPQKKSNDQSANRDHSV